MRDIRVSPNVEVGLKSIFGGLSCSMDFASFVTNCDGFKMHSELNHEPLHEKKLCHLKRGG